jgi:hypothetical protein
MSEENKKPSKDDDGKDLATIDPGPIPPDSFTGKPRPHGPREIDDETPRNA